MSCTKIAEGLHVAGHVITTTTDFRMWEAPPTAWEGIDADLSYNEATGNVWAGPYECERVFAHHDEYVEFVTVPNEPEEDKELAAILAHNEAAGFEAIPVPKGKKL